MNDRLEAQLSALSDGETSELELRSLLKQLGECEPAEREALMRTWSRYHVIGETLADERGDHLASNDFAAAVARQLADEPLPEHGETNADVANLPGNKSASPAVAPSWSRFAVAASVALAVVVGVQQYQLNTSQGAAEGQLVAGANTAMQAVVAADDSASQLAFSENLAPSEAQQAQALRAQQRLHEYMLEHANHAARQNGQGITPFARVANFEVEAN